MVQNFYELLNVSPTATFEELKRNYKHLILQCHPDKLQQQQQLEQSETKPDSKRNGDVTDNIVAVNLCPSACTTTTSTDPNVMLSLTEANRRKKFVAINEAWNTLKDPNKRKLYDAELLQSKFQTHSNIYDTITYKEMRREEVEVEEIDAEDDGTSEVEVAESNVDENHIKSAHNADKEIVESYDAAAGIKTSSNTAATTTTSVYYVYDCRCGGQYELDESAYKALQRSNTHKDNKCRRRQQHHHHYDQQQQKQQKETQKTRNLHQVPQSTSVKLTANADNDNNVDGVDVADYIDNTADEEEEQEVEDDDDEVIVECNECSLVIIVKHNRK